jgi:hypothetical protein
MVVTGVLALEEALKRIPGTALSHTFFLEVVLELATTRNAPVPDALRKALEASLAGEPSLSDSTEDGLSLDDSLGE